MKKIALLLLFFVSLYSKEITPSDVYSQVIQIQKELKIIKGFHNIDESAKVEKIRTILKPRHAWQKTYEIMVKINIFRMSNNLPIIQPVNMEPVLKLDPILTYEQTQRILSEITILKFRLNIDKKVSKAKEYKNKTPMDVYNALNIVSAQLDVLNGTSFTPSYVFGEAMRIYDDISMILNHLKITDNTIPMKKSLNHKPKDVFKTAMRILEKIKALEVNVGIDSIDFYAFRKDNATPSDVFSINQLILAELQVIKAYIGLNRYITPTASNYSSKTPAEVNQLMSWSLRKIELINSLNRRN